MAEHLGPYEIRGRLGAGAMAVVWLGYDPKLEREVAIKEPMRSAGMSDSMAAELAGRFVAEGKTAARLSHPSIVTIFAADVFDGRSAIVMELLRGHQLTHLIDHGHLPLSASLSIIDQLLDALDYAHTMGVVHRDVKPDNVMVTEDGRVKLTDFGVAHVSRVDAHHDAVIAGTPGYMSPEQIRGERVDARSDVFGLGAVAFEMLTGANPFGATDGLDAVSINGRVTSGVREQFPPGSAVPVSVQAVVLRALERDPALRYQSAGDMRSDLRVAATQELVAPPASLSTLVDTAAPSPNPPAAFTRTTVGSLAAKAPEKGSAGWIVGVAVGVAVALLGLTAMMAGGANNGVGLLVPFGGAIAGAVWFMYRGARDPQRVLPDEAAMLSGGLGAGDVVELSLDGPADSRVIAVALPAEVGRSSEVAVTLGDEMVSRRHARLERGVDGLRVIDLKSRNGTFVDGVDAGSGVPFLPGSVLRVGDTHITQKVSG